LISCQSSSRSNISTLRSQLSRQRERTSNRRTQTVGSQHNRLHNASSLTMHGVSPTTIPAHTHSTRLVPAKKNVQKKLKSAQNYWQTRNVFCATWYLPHSHVHNERTVPIIMAGCIAHAQNGHISTSGLKSDVTIVFLDPDFLKDAKILPIRP